MSKCRLICWTIFYHREIIVKEATGQIQEDLEVSEAQVEGIRFILKLWKMDRTIRSPPPVNASESTWLYMNNGQLIVCNH